MIRTKGQVGLLLGLLLLVEQKYAFSSRIGTDLPWASIVKIANISLFRSPLGDLNLDGRVNVLDLDIMCGNWLKKQNNLPGDSDGDGKVDFNDFVPFGQNWGLGAP